MAFNSKLTNRGKIIQAINWYKNYYYGVSNVVYIGIGGTSEWADDNAPDSVEDSILALPEPIGVSKATVDFVKPTVASGADIVYADGSYWDKVIPTDPSSDDYTNILTEEIIHLYIETVISYNQFALTNTFRRLSVNHNPLTSGMVLCSASSYDNSGIGSQGELKLAGNTSKIILTTGQSLTVGIILKF
jgi:hypothetical protein